MMRRGPPQAGKAGFALPTVLTVLSLLALVFVASLAALRGLHDETRAALDVAEFERTALSAEAHAAFVVATEPVGPDRIRVGGRREARMAGGGTTLSMTAGETPLYLDGRAYAWRPAGEAAPDPMVVSLQDEAGLINLDASRRDALMRLFAKVGLAGSAQETLADQILDDIDADDVRRPRGAEAADYARAGRPGPLNAPLARLPDVFGVLDWPRLVDALQWNRMKPWLCVDPHSTAFNVNTAPQAVLEVVLNMTERQASRVIAQRALGPITALSQIGLPDGGAASYAFPGGRFRFTVTDLRRRMVYQSSLVLTPAGRERPVWVEAAGSAHLGPGRDAVAGSSDVRAFPDPLGRPDHS